MADVLLCSIAAGVCAAASYAFGFYWGRRVGLDTGADRERIRLVKVGALASHWLPGFQIVCPPAPHPRNKQFYAGLEDE